MNRLMDVTMRLSALVLFALSALFVLWCVAVFAYGMSVIVRAVLSAL